MAEHGTPMNFAQLRSRIRVRERLPVWLMRLVFGVILLLLSELVMWQHPDSHTLLEWPVLLLAYVALGSLMLDLLVRFQARDLGGLLLVGGLYGLVSSVIISHSAFENTSAPLFSFVIRAMGLQTAAGFYGILLFTTVMRGKDIDLREVVMAAGVGALWGIWVHWYPIQTNIGWAASAISLDTAMLYLLPVLVLVGVLTHFTAPRFHVFREDQMTLLWWEAIVVVLPLFISLIVGMIPGKGGRSAIPYDWLGFAILIGAYCAWTLNSRERGYEPSILADMTFVAPNLATYIVLTLAFVVTGTLAYSVIDGPDSPVGVAVYVAVFAFGTAWLPLASLLIFWRSVRERRAAVQLSSDDKKEE
ncbi:MAG TPA: hypothetical protein VMT34_01625 [Aggregatilineales bacterium]|nr:hypothetical protein [Aggregatilineales bacterium]